ncbi:septum formation initiator family protein [Streptomyces griseoluteus]|uniref:septum formation initiator family protein n=1 Tax=Streptomyces griseoluteus TaxID=29306 RepID=UPI003659E2CA
MSSKPAPRGRAARLARLIPAGRARAARTPFVLLVVLLLGGGLLGLLVLNSALSEGSFEQDDIQRRTKSLTDEEQALQRDIDAYSAPDALQRRARELGMVPGGDPAFLGPDGSVKGVPSPAPRSAALTGPRAPEALTAAPSTARATAPARAPGSTPVSRAATTPAPGRTPGSTPVSRAATTPAPGGALRSAPTTPTPGR